MMKPAQVQLVRALQHAWSRETSYEPQHWSSSNPAVGQCAVSAVLVQDFLGGDIVRCHAVESDGHEVEHYFNVIEGIEFDVTAVQFTEGTTMEMPRVTTREYVLSFPETLSRYLKLRASVLQVLAALERNER